VRDNLPLSTDLVVHLLNMAMNHKLTVPQIKNTQCKWTNQTIYKFALRCFPNTCPVKLALASNYLWASLKRIDANRRAKGLQSFYCRV
jgi:hypothetical protein